MMYAVSELPALARPVVSGFGVIACIGAARLGAVKLVTLGRKVELAAGWVLAETGRFVLGYEQVEL